MGVYSATTEAEEALAAATAETLLLLLGATTVKATLVEWGVSFDGVTSGNAPVVVELYQITANGTATAATEVSWDRSAKTAEVSAHHSFTAEPTKGSRLAMYEVHPQGGSLVIQYPLGREPVICDGSASQGIAIVVTAPDAVNASAYAVWHE